MSKKNVKHKKTSFVDDEISFNDKQIVAVYNAGHAASKDYVSKKQVKDVKDISEASLNVKCLNERQKMLKNSINDKDIVVSVGPAGTGKTYIALLTALHQMKKNPMYEKLVLVKSVQVVKGEEIGYLKGSLDEKIAPFMMSFSSNLDKILKSKEATKTFLESGIFEYQPIAYVRGMTFTDCIVIVDEIQNITFDTFKTIITRIGQNCKMIFLGDKDQIDLKDKSSSCINKVLEIFKDQDFMGVIEFLEGDSVRHKLIPTILKLMEQ